MSDRERWIVYPLLFLALGASLLLHGALLAVRFVPPDAFQFKPVDPGLEVILVNAKHANKPLKAEALAQANLDGGGNADAGRAQSPLPDLRRMETGESVKATQRRIAELEHDLARLGREGELWLSCDEQDVAEAAHRGVRRLLDAERRNLAVLDEDVIEQVRRHPDVSFPLSIFCKTI